VAIIRRRAAREVRERSGGDRGALLGAFTLLTFGGIDFGDMVYVEHPVGAVHISKGDEVAVARLKFDRLRSLALDPDDSVELIQRVAAAT
jgi:hypothetical protein